MRPKLKRKEKKRKGGRKEERSEYINKQNVLRERNRKIRMKENEDWIDGMVSVRTC